MVAGTHRKPSGELGEVSAGNHSVAQRIAGGSKVAGKKTMGPSRGFQACLGERMPRFTQKS